MALKARLEAKGHGPIHTSREAGSSISSPVGEQVVAFCSTCTGEWRYDDDAERLPTVWPCHLQAERERRRAARRLAADEQAAREAAVAAQKRGNPREGGSLSITAATALACVCLALVVTLLAAAWLLGADDPEVQRHRDRVEAHDG